MMTAEKKRYKTKDILEETGISRQVLQQYITMGLVKEAGRTEGGHRIFNESAVKRIKIIQMVNDTGYTLRGMRETFKHGMET